MGMALRWYGEGVGAVVIHIFGFSRYDIPINCPGIFNALKGIHSRNIEHKLDRQRDYKGMFSFNANNCKLCVFGES